MNIKPLSNNVIIEPIEEEKKEEKTEGGIIIPETARKDDNERPAKGKVVAVGPGLMTENNERLEMSVKVGDEVLFDGGFNPSDSDSDNGAGNKVFFSKKSSPIKVKSDGKEYLLIGENKIYGVIED